MTQITMAFVDLIGTVACDNGAIERAVQAALGHVTDAASLPPGVDGRFRRARGAAKLDMFEAIMGDRRLAMQAHRHFEEAVEGEIGLGAFTPVTGAQEAIAGLREQGLKVALATGLSRRNRDALVDYLGWTGQADLVLSPGGQIRGRPHPDLILAAVIRLRIDAVQQVAVAGDTANDLLAGDRAGAAVIAGILGGAHTREELERGPHTHILPGITDLPMLIAGHRMAAWRANEDHRRVDAAPNSTVPARPDVRHPAALDAGATSRRRRPR